MTIEFKLPDIGEGVAEGEIVKWMVSTGDSVEEHQSVVEVMTDKATVEVPAPAAGVITELRAAEGDVVPVGSVIYILSTGEGAGAPTAVVAAAPAAAPSAAPAAAPPAASAPAAAPAPAPMVAAPTPRSGGRVRAVPSARRVARELGVDLHSVAGTGQNGIVRRADVEAHATSATAVTAVLEAPAPASAESHGGGERREPFRGIRRKIAEAMSRSVQTAAHFTVVEEIDVTDLVRLRAEAKVLGAEQGIKVTYMPFIMKAVALALGRFPELNSSLDEAAQEVVFHGSVHLGIATDTDNGLIVPVIRDVGQKGIYELARELGEMSERVRAGKASSDELTGSTFTITNAGNIGGTLATPIINFPEVAILGVHRIQKKPAVVTTLEGDRIEIRQLMNLSSSIDHRLVDGASGARFLVDMKRTLENPGLLAL